MSRSGSTTVRVRYAETDQMGIAWHTRLTDGRGARVSFDYEVRREGTEGPLATGSTSHAAIDLRGRPRRLPEELRRRLA
jgi:acyl-CoA thioester hydrolase